MKPDSAPITVRQCELCRQEGKKLTDLKSKASLLIGQNYRIATLSFNATGGDGYRALITSRAT